MDKVLEDRNALWSYLVSAPSGTSVKFDNHTYRNKKMGGGWSCGGMRYCNSFDLTDLIISFGGAIMETPYGSVTIKVPRSEPEVGTIVTYKSLNGSDALYARLRVEDGWMMLSSGHAIDALPVPWSHIGQNADVSTLKVYEEVKK